MSLRSALCRLWWGSHDLSPDLRCLSCGVRFRDRHEAKLLGSFVGFMALDPSREVDREIARLKEFQMLGYRVVRGGQIKADREDVSGRRVVGGVEVSQWGDAPEPWRAKPIVVPMKEAEGA